MAKKKLAKKLDRLEAQAEELKTQAEELREAAAGKAEQVAHSASAKAEEIEAELGDAAEGKSGGAAKGVLALLLAVLAGAGIYLKRKREQELDEALWEEPREL